ncbi:hypothetical protein P22_1120 [Propionispora sp. 2/2-37]|uniref:carbohydrate kinase family protein n=1 Tax=Propionispora sp. 2/2-37 TaxID=1677858 RepID=UPI0006BB8867|nr:carbohydrate kinase family protein [Propionispora sp. 2/2-37]CUH95051.1 hypothetical protein P22_1120 [Propionispora sp. 2/2-37]
MRMTSGKNFDVVGLGVSTLDMFTVVEKFPATREVQKAVDMILDGGGPVATALVALARLGAQTAMLDRLGDDWVGSLILRDFHKNHVGTDSMDVVTGHSSSVANILVEKGTGNRAILYHPGSVPEIADIMPYAPFIRSAKILHLNGRHREAVLPAIAIARQAGVKISFDGGANRYHPGMREIVPQVDICIVARDFAVQYTGKSSVEQAGPIFLESGPELVVITDGIRGSWVWHKDSGCFHQPAFVVETVDTTGCGDSYHGAFLYGLIQELPLKKSAELASAVSAINAQTLGGRNGLPLLGQVTSFLAERSCNK